MLTQSLFLHICCFACVAAIAVCFLVRTKSTNLAVIRSHSMAARSPRKGYRDKTAARIDEIAERREQRRLAQEQQKAYREKQAARNQAEGRGGDVDFQRLIEDWRYNRGEEQLPHTAGTNVKINIVARKRPIGAKEVERCDYDSVTVLNPQVVVHYPKMKVDGITKYLENQTFQFDHVCTPP